MELCRHHVCMWHVICGSAGLDLRWFFFMIRMGIALIICSGRFMVFYLSVAPQSGMHSLYQETMVFCATQTDLMQCRPW